MGWREILKYLPKKKLFCSSLAVTKSQPYILLMAEQKKAFINHGGKETHLHVGLCTTPRLQSWCKKGGSAQGLQTRQLCVPSASVPPRAAGQTPALTHWVQRFYWTSWISPVAQRRQLLALPTGTVKSMSYVERKAGKEGGEQAMSEL